MHGERIVPVPESVIDQVVENEDMRISRLERVLVALKTREAYSKGSNPVTITGLDSADYIELKPEELAFMHKFLDFRVEIPEGVEPDYIFVPTTSPLIDRDRFHDRVKGGVELGQKYPGAKVVYAGKMPAVERRTGREDEIGPEAELMAKEAVEEGLQKEQVTVEIESGHAKESIEFFLRDHHDEILKRDEPMHVIITTSQTMLRRCYYCVELFLREQYADLKGKVEFSYLPAGNDLDPPNDRAKFYDESGNFVEECGYFSMYEARRLLEYRKKGWL